MRGSRVFWLAMITAVMMSVTTTFLPAQTEEPLILDDEVFLRMVLENHPVAIQANLQPEVGRQMVRAARGAFDPVLSSSADVKEFGGTDYFRVLDAGLKVPTWYGVKATAGYLRSDGVYLDPSASTPAEGLATVGLEWTPLQGLMIDKRRSGLMKAKIYANASIAERQTLLNDLVLDASEAYWEWVRAWHASTVYDSAVSLAEVRYKGVVAGFRGGARAAIDTTEAMLQLQARQADRIEAGFKLAKAKAMLESFLWTPNQEPLDLQSVVLPPPLSDFAQRKLTLPDPTTLDTLVEGHPELLQAAYKLDLMEIDRRMMVEQLKPDFMLKYQWLSSPQSLEPGSKYGPGPDNYKLSAGFTFPVFVREARGQLAQVKLNQQAAELSLADKRRQVVAKASAYQAGVEAMVAQRTLSAQMLANHEALTTAEARRFQAGESTLFMVNLREQNLIKARLEYIGLAASVPVMGVRYQWSLGFAGQ